MTVIKEADTTTEVVKTRGFEEVVTAFRTAFETFTDEKKGKHKFPIAIKLPTRSDPRSAGYDFYVPKDIRLLPMQKTIVSTDVKAYMQQDEVLQLYIRSSLAIKSGLMLSNNVGIVDSSYYSNEGNDGNIGISLVNTTGLTVELKAGDRFAQGIFIKYLIADEDTAEGVRTGGFGSSGK